MDLNTIKKELYKQKPNAVLNMVDKRGIHYWSRLDGVTIVFLIPLNDIGDGKFEDVMPAQLLIRWITI